MEFFVGNWAVECESLFGGCSAKLFVNFIIRKKICHVNKKLNSKIIDFDEILCEI